MTAAPAARADILPAAARAHAVPEPSPPAPRAPVPTPAADGPTSPAAGTIPEVAPGAGLLDPLHPALRRRALALYGRLRDEGIAVRFIHGFAPYKPRKRMGPGGMANWHNFGLAFDLNLMHRTGLADAKAHFDDDAEIWRRIGLIAEELGLVWGGGWRSTYDPFHFEWHPGHDAIINAGELRDFLKLAGRRAKRWQRVWTLFPAD